MIAVLNIEDIEEGSSKGLEANSIYMFAVKKDNQIYLYWNRCPHLGTPLEWEEDRFLDAEMNIDAKLFFPVMRTHALRPMVQVNNRFGKTTAAQPIKRIVKQGAIQKRHNGFGKR